MPGSISLRLLRRACLPVALLGAAALGGCAYYDPNAPYGTSYAYPGYAAPAYAEALPGPPAYGYAAPAPAYGYAPGYVGGTTLAFGFGGGGWGGGWGDRDWHGHDWDHHGWGGGWHGNGGWHR